MIHMPSKSTAGLNYIGGDNTVSMNDHLEKKVLQGSGARSNKDVIVNIPAASSGSVPRAADPGRAYDVDAHIPYSVSLPPGSPSGFPSQPILRPSKNEETRRCDSSIRDKRYDPFKTFSGRLERQQEPSDGVSPESKISKEERDQAADRFFAALEGPVLDELEALRETESPLVPQDKKWPFLLRFPITAFGMCLGVGTQALLWKTLASAPSMAFLHVSPAVSHALWYAELPLMGLVSFIYLLKVIFFFEAVRREFHHPVRASFFLAPWNAWLLLVQSSPGHTDTSVQDVGVEPLWGFRFSLASWAYLVPMTGASIAMITYATEVDNVLTRALSVVLSAFTIVTAVSLLATTVFHAFVRRDLFPNDESLRITLSVPASFSRHGTRGCSWCRARRATLTPAPVQGPGISITGTGASTSKARKKIRTKSPPPNHRHRHGSQA